MLGSTSPIGPDLHFQISILMNQTDRELAAYSAGGGALSLLKALKTQGQIVSALLNATGLATPLSATQIRRIASLR